MAVDHNAINSLVQEISEQQRNSLYRLLRDHDSRVALRSRLAQHIHAVALLRGSSTHIRAQRRLAQVYEALLLSQLPGQYRGLPTW